jgi:hypothetical protein
MRKAIGDSHNAKTVLTLKVMQVLIDKGYRFVQVRGITVDKHYEYIEPNCIILIPMLELPADQAQKDIYEPIDSELLRQWATEQNKSFKIYVQK